MIIRLYRNGRLDSIETAKTYVKHYALQAVDKIDSKLEKLYGA